MRYSLLLFTTLFALFAVSVPLRAQNGHWEYATSTVYGAGSAGIRQENLSVEEMRTYEKGIFSLSRNYTTVMEGVANKEYNAKYTAELGNVYRKMKPGTKLEVKVKLSASQGGGPLDYSLWGRAMVVYVTPGYSRENFRSRRVKADGNYEGSLTTSSGQGVVSVHGDESATFTLSGKVTAPPKGSAHMYLVLTFAEMAVVYQYDWVSDEADIYLKSVTFPPSGKYEEYCYTEKVHEEYADFQKGNFISPNAAERKEKAADLAKKYVESKGPVELSIRQTGAADFDVDVHVRLSSGDLGGTGYRHIYHLRGLKQQYRFGDTMDFTLEEKRVYDQNSFSTYPSHTFAAANLLQTVQKTFDPRERQVTTDNVNDANGYYISGLSMAWGNGESNAHISYEVMDPKNYSEDLVLTIPLYCDGAIEIRYGWAAAGGGSGTVEGGSSGLGSAAPWIGVGGGLLIGGGAAVRARRRKKKAPGQLARKKNETYEHWLKRQTKYEQKKTGTLFPVKPKPGEDYADWKDRQAKADREGREKIYDEAAKYNVPVTDPTTGEMKDLGQIREETKKALRRKTTRENRKEENWIQQQANEEELGYSEAYAEAELTDTVAEGTLGVMSNYVPGGKEVRDAHAFLKAVGVRVSEQASTEGSIMKGVTMGAAEGALSVGQNRIGDLEADKFKNKAVGRVVKVVGQAGVEGIKTYAGAVYEGKNPEEALNTAIAKSAGKAVGAAVGEAIDYGTDKAFRHLAGKQWSNYQKVAQAARKNPSYENVMKQYDKLGQTSRNLNNMEQMLKADTGTFNEALNRDIIDPYFQEVSDAMNGK